MLTTAAIEGEERRSATAEDMRGTIDWAEAENAWHVLAEHDFARAEIERLLRTTSYNFV